MPDARGREIGHPEPGLPYPRPRPPGASRRFRGLIYRCGVGICRGSDGPVGLFAGAQPWWWFGRPLLTVLVFELAKLLRFYCVVDRAESILALGPIRKCKRIEADFITTSEIEKAMGECLSARFLTYVGDEFGDKFAAENSGLIGALVSAMSQDFHTAVLCKTLREVAEVIRRKDFAAD